jgi:glutamate synthase domain-containing protein 3
VLVVGGAAGDYLGEYMAGGLLIVLGLGRESGWPISGIYTGTGMHGGKMILGDDVEDFRLGREVGKSDLDDADRVELRQYVEQYVEAFGGNADQIMDRPFCKLLPVSRRPYGQIYVY